MNPYATGNYLRKEAETLRTQLAEAREMLAHYQEQNRTLKTACKGALAALSQNATLPADIAAAKLWLSEAISKVG